MWILLVLSLLPNHLTLTNVPLDARDSTMFDLEADVKMRGEEDVQPSLTSNVSSPPISKSE